MKEEWLFHGAVVPVDAETTAALVTEIKRLIDVIGGIVLAQPEQEPFGYFKAEPFGWTDCAETDEGAKALYEAHPAQRQPLTGLELYTAYITATNQTLRPQNERLVFAFARAIEAAHGIKEKT